MTRRTRKILFYFFLLLFFLLTPPTIFYAMGYSFNWQNFTFTKNGGLYFKSMPTGAKIFVDGSLKKTTPRLISRLTPQNYEIKIEKDGFSSWQKTLTVEPELVTEARNILLFPKNITPMLVATTSPENSIKLFLASDQERQKDWQAQAVASSSATWQRNGDTVYYLGKKDRLLYETDLTASIKNQLSKQPLPTAKNYQIIEGSGKYFLLLADVNLYLLKNGLFELLAGETKNALISKDNKKLIYWNDKEIYAYYLEDVLIQPYKKAGEKEVVTRYSQNISQAIFYPNNEYVAFVVDDQIKIAELDGRGQRNIIDLALAKNPQIYFDQPNSYLYYLTDDQLWRIKLEF